MDYHLVTTAPTDEKMKHTESGTINGGMLPKDICRAPAGALQISCNCN